MVHGIEKICQSKLLIYHKCSKDVVWLFLMVGPHRGENYRKDHRKNGIWSTELEETNLFDS